MLAEAAFAVLTMLAAWPKLEPSYVFPMVGLEMPFKCMKLLSAPLRSEDMLLVQFCWPPNDIFLRFCIAVLATELLLM